MMMSCCVNFLPKWATHLCSFFRHCFFSSSSSSAVRLLHPVLSVLLLITQSSSSSSFSSHYHYYWSIGGIFVYLAKCGRPCGSSLVFICSLLSRSSSSSPEHYIDVIPRCRENLCINWHITLLFGSASAIAELKSTNLWRTHANIECKKKNILIINTVVI